MQRGERSFPLAKQCWDSRGRVDNPGSRVTNTRLATLNYTS